MKLLMFIFCVIPALVTSITISPNGNSPEIKMIGGMMVDVQKGFTPMASNKVEAIIDVNNYEKSRKSINNFTKLSINERYRRLIPYMTFYYANDLATPTTETYNTKNVEVEKAEIIEATTIGQSNDRQPKKIYYPAHRNIPRYQGNRLTQYNIASANPTKFLYKEVVPVYQNPVKLTPNYNPLLSDAGYVIDNDYDYQKIAQKPIVKAPSAPFVAPSRKPYVNFYNNEDSANVRYYLSDKEHVPKFKLVPYEQTPPVAVLPQNDQFYELKKPVRVLIPKEQVYIKPRPQRPQFYYDNANIQQPTPRKPPTPSVSTYYEKRRPHPVLIQPVVESGFKPMANLESISTEGPIYSTTLPDKSSFYYESLKQQHVPQSYDTSTVAPKLVFNQNYYQYVVEQQTSQPEPQVEYKPHIAEQATYSPQPLTQHTANTISLTQLINSLQLNKTIPNPITKDNVGYSIRTLLQILNSLKAAPHHNEVESPVLSTPAPFVNPEVIAEVPAKPVIEATPVAIDDEPEFHEEPYLAPVKTPSQHLDDFPNRATTSQRFPLPITSDDEGGTPGQPGVDYPILTTIPQTRFNCKTQRYKGFFADPETRCQVWHYCDLNGGQASFLCPNGTIFSQAALTCDWWFNVQCSSTAQLYVLNESLYKYILPHSPKFPEDYSGPLVDKYLTLKFKEMEEQFKKNKNKKTASDKMDDEDTEDSSETPETTSAPDHDDVNTANVVSEASVIVATPGSSGNVERLSD
ncbi:uncharacterized protein LOC106137622 [Amyelois transitella]|uniref:uncharacterized protein LOC106137622 n=1 Tax=Amyelois transitella TaxID=680683 RepID=UPI0029905095|nr:uncharacterized protein LOC106137622 [Amyelois transitella]